MTRRSMLLLALAGWLPASDGPFYVYIGDITADSVLIAWGATKGKAENTIGRDSAPWGEATIQWDARELKVSDRNWVRLGGLAPDRVYPYEVHLGGRLLGRGTVRTHPRSATRLAFLVIGDYGTGKKPQWELAKRMADLVRQRRESSNPVRFVLTTGDNVYGHFPYWFGTGDRDDHWEKTHFGPYAGVLAEIPFYMTLGNHDGNESERRGDLPVQLDNFFFPGDRPARYYRFSYADLADFFALDTSSNTTEGSSAFALSASSEQFAWLRGELARSSHPWKIACFHHPPFSAGPRHRGRLADLAHLHELLARHRVPVVFNGHEHNFQFTRPAATGGIQYVVTGSGGQLRTGKPAPADLAAEHIAGWSPQRQFCLVEIDGTRMAITPIGTEPVRARGADGADIRLPILVNR